MNKKYFQTGLGLLAQCAGLALTMSSVLAASDLQAPFRVEVDGKPIDTDIGHAVPLAVDFDGDGKADLLVGQFGDGKLRIYRNEGTSSEPKFKTFAWFKAEGSFGKVPAG